MSGGIDHLRSVLENLADNPNILFTMKVSACVKSMFFMENLAAQRFIKYMMKLSVFLE